MFKNNPKLRPKGMSNITVQKGKCSICGDTVNLQTHHLSYRPEVFVILCRGCHGDVHGNPTGFVQKKTKYGYEDFRAEQENFELIEKYVTIFIKGNKILRQMFMKHELTMKILYGFGPIFEKKEVLEETWEDMASVMTFFAEHFIKRGENQRPSFAHMVKELKEVKSKYGRDAFEFIKQAKKKYEKEQRKYEALGDIWKGVVKEDEPEYESKRNDVIYFSP